MKSRKERKLIIVLCSLAMIFVMSTFAFADVEGTVPEEKNGFAVMEVENVNEAEDYVKGYFEENNIDIELGTPEYAEFLTDILMFENNDVLKDSEGYENFKIYASEYLSEMNNGEKTVVEEDAVLLNSEEQEKTIDEIKQEANEEEAESSADSVAVLALETESSYSDKKAVAYARKWAKSRNSKYKDHGGNDCTNFVSQCVAAGGESMKKPSSVPEGVKDTTKYWYSVKYQADYRNNNPVYAWKETTSFTRVADFYTYWKNKNITTASYSSKAKLQNGASVGDVVQLKNGDGKYFHSIIITGGSKGNRTYCAHSHNKLDAYVKNISDVVAYRALKF